MGPYESAVGCTIEVERIAAKPVPKLEIVLATVVEDICAGVIDVIAFVHVQIWFKHPLDVQEVVPGQKVQEVEHP